MKKVILYVSLFILIFTGQSVNALTIEEKKFIDEKIFIIHSKLEKHSDFQKDRVYKYFQRYLKKKITSKNKELIEYILTHFQGETYDISSHNSIILRFSKLGNHSQVIESKKEQIMSHGSVFIFRNNSTDLTISDIRSITQKLKAINKNILIFIDQEGGYVNRYMDFESGTEVDQLFEIPYVNERFQTLSEWEQLQVRSLFPYYSGYFPSFGKLGQKYDVFTSIESQTYFLEIVTYLRLKTLKDNGINTYGLVADLNYGNPAISGNSRSFSRHGEKYKRLIDAFIKASHETGIILYLKHFPGHGAGLVDSHKGVLDVSSQSDYLDENFQLFQYFLENSHSLKGLMVAHILFPSEMQKRFNTLISKADFLLTDDLAMQGFKKICSHKSTSLTCSDQGSLFSTELIFSNKNLIKVDTQYVEKVY